MNTSAPASSAPSSFEAGHAEELISKDLVSVLVQVATLNPNQLGLFVPKLDAQRDLFPSALTGSFREAGYAVRRVDNGNSSEVSYSVSRSEELNQGNAFTYTVSVNGVSVRRSYQIHNTGDVSPVAVMQVRGTDASQLSLNNGIFNQ